MSNKEFSIEFSSKSNSIELDNIDQGEALASTRIIDDRTEEKTYYPTIEFEKQNKLSRIYKRITHQKSISALLLNSDEDDLKRTLNRYHLLLMGVGAIIGAGIFVYSGLVAANNAGPAVILCFIIAGFSASLSALAYAELSSMVPVAGSTYTFTFVTFGEFVAWMIGWMLILEYTVGTAAVTVGWSGYLKSFFKNAFNTVLDSKLTNSPILWNEAEQRFIITGDYFNLPAMLINIIITCLLIVGTKESATMTSITVTIKVLIILVFIFSSIKYIKPELWSPFIPDQAADGVYGHYGAFGILKGSSVVFFCYTGFDAVSTMAQEAKNPKKDMPVAIIGSLVISTILYIVVCLVMVGLVPYYLLNVPEPISLAIESTGLTWLAAVIDFSAVLGILTTIIMQMLGQSRIFFAMAKDGLLPKSFMKLHYRFKTPYISQVVVGIITTIMSGCLPVDLLGELSGVGTLFAFVLVNLSVMILRLRYPQLERPFKMPFGPYFLPILGSLVSLALVISSSPSTLIRLAIWALIGIVIYIIWYFKNSNNRID
ncbi:amino acid transporter [Neoconidiobolus thromboides FSU 785]|nr:amino acid transporter [Neoconidiobolus thromboides FSU 785]